MRHLHKAILLTLFVNIASLGLAQLNSNELSKIESLVDEYSDTKGQVKKIKITGYYVNDKFGEITKKDVLSWKRVVYDIKGATIESESWKKSDNKEPIKKIYVIRYDNQNKEEQVCYNSDGTLDSKAVWTYDNQNREIESVFYNSDGTLNFKVVSKYDNDKIIQENCYKGDGSLSQKVLYKYNNDTTNREELTYDSSENLTSKWLVCDKNDIPLESYSYYKSLFGYDEKTVYKHDNTGKETYQASYKDYGNGYVKDAEEFYNENGDIIMEKSYGNADNGVIDYTYQYKYDKKGNWIEKIVFETEAKIVSSIIEREIEYYE
ncbi:MAG: hypothetical protein FWD60_04375 [Candidatus Azobacteroides sp.]|nr:hypothetical protein [Candidatus Azobacteroides sp.]